MAGATKEALRAATTEQLRKHSRAGRSQTAFSPKTLRAAGLLSVAGVGSFLTARCGALRAATAPWPQPKSLAAAPLVVSKPALNAKLLVRPLQRLRVTQVPLEQPVFQLLALFASQPVPGRILAHLSHRAICRLECRSLDGDIENPIKSSLRICGHGWNTDGTRNGKGGAEMGLSRRFPPSPPSAELRRTGVAGLLRRTGALPVAPKVFGGAVTASVFHPCSIRGSIPAIPATAPSFFLPDNDFCIIGQSIS